MTKIPSLFRFLGAFALLALSAGCTETLTKQPFGKIETVKKGDGTAALNGTWHSPATRPKERMTLTVTLSENPEGPATADLLIHADKEEQAYEARLHRVETGVKNSPVAVVFFRPKNSDKPWRFLWLGGAANANNNSADILLAFMPDTDAFKSLGIGFDENFRTNGYDPFIDDKARLLTDSPEKILAALQGKDLRTFMIATAPFVFLRRPPVEAPATPAVAAPSAAEKKTAEAK